MDEARFIEALISDLIKILLQSKNLPYDVAHGSYSDKMDYIGKELRGKIGIITPYKSQVRTLKDCIYPKLRALKLSIDMVEINTVDAYQGREKEIIIISCVRGSQERTLGFLNDYRRMNVAITRAKNFLWVVGNSRTLTRNKNWEAFIKYCRGKS
jgi:senataxin